MEVTPTTSTPANFEWMGNRKEGRKEGKNQKGGRKEEEGLCLRPYAVRLALRGGGEERGGEEAQREEEREILWRRRTPV